MTPEESKRLSTYILKVLTLMENRVGVFQFCSGTFNYNVGHSTMNYNVGWFESDEDELVSEMKIFNEPSDGINYSFKGNDKLKFLERGFDKDDYFNCSVQHDLILSYEDLKEVLSKFCTFEETITINIPYVVYDLVIKGELDEHPPVSGN